MLRQIVIYLSFWLLATTVLATPPDLSDCYNIGYLTCSSRYTCTMKPGQYHQLCVMLGDLDKGYDYTCQFKFREGVAFTRFIIDYVHANKLGMNISQLNDYII